MGRRRIVRLQVGLLFLITLLVVGRSMWTAKVSAERAVVLDGLSADELAEGAFELTAPTSLRIAATGSVARRDVDTTLAAYAWIIDALSGAPVWIMHPSDAVSRRGTLVTVDTVLTLDAGRYHVYFASFGHAIGASRRSGFLSRLFREEDHWVNDARRWSVEIRPESGAEAFARQDAPLTPDSLVVFTTGPMSNNQQTRHVIEVRSAVEVMIRSAGEFVSGDRRDYGWIVDMQSADTLWMLTHDRTEWAGGTIENRISTMTLKLDPGLYAAGYSTDSRHAWNGWRANPPFDPRAWGLTISLTRAIDSTSVSRFDPRRERDPVIDLTRIGNDENAGIRFHVSDTVSVVLEALGEISRSRYDYGWLETVSGERVWEMTDAQSVHAGGHASNRREIAFIELAPGEYRLRYETDGSHAHGAWRHDPPDMPDRWGVAMWPRDPADAALFEIVEDEHGGDTEIEERALSDTLDVASTAVIEGRGPILVDLTSLGNEQEVSETFTLESTGDVFVRAVGEITLNNRFDFGWLENAATGERLWEMTYDNTVSAGGAGRNRLYEGVLKLPAGDYRVRFQTDFSHAYGDFPSGEAPDDAAAWGIQVRLFE